LQIGCMTHRKHEGLHPSECRGQLLLHVNAAKILLVSEKPGPRKPRRRVGFLLLQFVWALKLR
jgi:hypothetical protein